MQQHFDFTIHHSLCYADRDDRMRYGYLEEIEQNSSIATDSWVLQIYISRLRKSYQSEVFMYEIASSWVYILYSVELM